jgi:RimJ/RimL family protein N-acetyltransferase
MQAAKPYSRAEMALPAERLETERLLLRPLVAGDVDCLMDMDTDPQVMRYIPGYLVAPEKAAEYRKQQLADLAAGERFKFLYAIELKEAPGQAVGWMILRPTEDGEWIELGYRLVQRMWGQGIVPEASRACIKAAFDLWQVPRVMAVIYPGNRKSARVLEKLAFAARGQLRIYDLELELFVLDAGPAST